MKTKPTPTDDSGAVYPGAGAPTDAGSGATITSDLLRSKMQIPPQFQNAYASFVTAARKVMYSPQMIAQIKAQLQGAGTLAQKIGQGVVALVSMLISKSGNAIPPQIVVPATLELIGHAAELLRTAGVKVTDQDVSGAMEVAIQIIFERAGVDPQKLMTILAGHGGPGGQTAPGAGGAPPAAMPPGPQGAPGAGAAPAPGGAPQPPAQPGMPQ
jgi:hypothetical protein